MTIDAGAIQGYFSGLGLGNDIAAMYVALHEHGPQTITELSRNSQVERTRIYRLLGELQAARLIEVETHYKRGIIKAAPIANLRILINQKTHELESLEGQLDMLEKTLLHSSLSNPATRVQFYHGTEGIRQILWNQLGSRSPLVGYHFQILGAGAGNSFMHRWAAEVEQRQLQHRLLLGDDYVKSWLARKPSGRRIGGIDYHYLSPSVFEITHSCDVYDDVTVYYNWKNSEVFGIEIYNQQIADAQRCLLQGLWEQSSPETRF